MVISNLLLEWYDKEGRELPWRVTKNPYEIWVSEIILQQTRISQGLDYYHAFLKQFPDVFSLARADISEVLNIWQGLGYYSRARNMHAAAKTLVEKYGGKFPTSYTEILKLKGIGEYTAGALASIAFGETVPAVDGNVKRVFARLSGIEKDISLTETGRGIREQVARAISKERPGDFNQALMDLGSMVCKPVNPDCPVCPLSGNCAAYKLDRVKDIPLKYRKQKIRTRYFLYSIVYSGQNIFIRKRIQNDIWKELYEFPVIETSEAVGDERIKGLITHNILSEGIQFQILKVSPSIRHILSHQQIIARFVHIRLIEFDDSLNNKYLSVTRSDINTYPLPRLIEKYLPEL